MQKKLSLVQKAHDDSQSERRQLSRNLESLQRDQIKLKNAKQLASLETEMNGPVTMTPEEIIILQDENRELKDWGKVRKSSLGKHMPCI